MGVGMVSDALNGLTTGVGYVSTAVVVLAVIFKGLPRFIELYTLAQESIRKTLLEEVASLKKELATERLGCAEKIAELWDRIENMRQIINHLVVRSDSKELTPIGGAINRAFNTPQDMTELLGQLNAPFPSHPDVPSLEVPPIEPGT
jgi:hypothetical protein